MTYVIIAAGYLAFSVVAASLLGRFLRNEEARDRSNHEQFVARMKGARA